METQDILILGLASLVAGFGMFWFLLAVLRRKLRNEHAAQKRKILKEAQTQAQRVKSEAHARAEAKRQMSLEELDTLIVSRQEDLKTAESELQSQEESAVASEALLKRREKEIEQHTVRVKAFEDIVEGQKTQQQQIRIELKEQLAKVSGEEVDRLRKSLYDNLVESRQLEAQKILKMVTEDLNDSSKRLAQRMLARSLSRYAPEFVWPKSVSHVEVKDRYAADALGVENAQLLMELRELSGAVIEFLPAEGQHLPSVKFVGGFGMFREAARLSFEELVPKQVNQWTRVKESYQKHLAVIEQQAVKLGRHAVNELRLKNIHPEIQKMVGSLNWRTSYRQNQFHHSLEVARLAGMLACEMGVDPDLAKRCGLLHDIGKSIDYRIEGSHAVISGDYADRYGESRLICDSVMSHHNDLRVETPLAYVLKAADTLSGARPGARVNLEEGYQIRLSAIDDIVRSFPGVNKSAIMNGGREVHVEVNHKRVREDEIQQLSAAIAKRIEEEVQFPGQIKVLVTRRFEAVAVA